MQTHLPVKRKSRDYGVLSKRLVRTISMEGRCEVRNERVTIRKIKSI